MSRPSPRVPSRHAKRSVMFRQWSQKQLRWAFLSLGVVLIGSVLSLTYAMHKRLVLAQRDREEMVALRVFDELEREINAFLETENDRDSYQNLTQTNPELWAPFVVGYFKVGSAEEFVAADGATSENRRRMIWSIQKLRDQLGETAPPSDPEPAPIPVQIQTQAPTAVKETKNEAPPSRMRSEQTKEKETVSQSQDAASGSKIIESLNRAPERRKQQAAPKAAVPAGKPDPFSDYAESY